MTRTILIHLNVEAPDSDARDADEIAADVMAALTVGQEGAPQNISALRITNALSEEIEARA